MNDIIHVYTKNVIEINGILNNHFIFNTITERNEIMNVKYINYFIIIYRQIYL